MTTTAFILVLSSAFMHASWNYFAKRAGGGAAFVWLFSCWTTILYAPVALYVLSKQQTQLELIDYVFMAGSALLHIAYFLVLQRGYKVGDLSLIYPLARGTGPTLSTLAAILIFSERPTALALAGASLVIISVFLIAGGAKLFRAQKSLNSRKAIRFGLITGSLIACYTLWDKYAVGVLLIAPVLFDWSSNLLRSLFLTPAGIKNWQEVKHHWQKHKLEVFMVAILSPLAYMFILTALSFSPVSYIAPAREISILIGALMGAQLLKEGDQKRRLGAAFIMVIGVIMLALG